MLPNTMKKHVDWELKRYLHLRKQIEDLRRENKELEEQNQRLASIIAKVKKP